ncbi:hypothetical protein Lal_00003897 [Lupinus albus]|uniref:Putative glucan endo-1,3-beta-D-glucosidase n=1 Tax=Lupinus albus TaxID=3870 RepID=A0A6A4NX57_LUPAL|nr:putative glucan endo-1,3-beta-D-glucosidase [Lupinus albus]KAF1893982.1 hypothetical protein Lal_00003897 [Lupinus albus]
MAKEAYMCLLFISFLIIFCSSTMVGFSNHEREHTTSSVYTLTTFLKKNKTQIQLFCFFCAKSSILSKRESLRKFHMRRILDDTNPTPKITVPSTNSVTVSPTNPTSIPETVPSTTTPIPLSPTNPANSQVTAPTSVLGTPPPSTTTTTTIPSPLGNTNAPNTPGQFWCVAKSGVPESTIQTALDYCCGMDSVACSQIQQGGSCYNPNSLQNHASVAFNSYYQKNPAPTSCDFGGVATLVNTNPSSGSCIYTSSSGAATSSSNGPSSVIGYQSPPPNGVDTSHSSGLRPFIGCMVILISIINTPAMP